MVWDLNIKLVVLMFLVKWLMILMLKYKEVLWILIDLFWNVYGMNVKWVEYSSKFLNLFIMIWFKEMVCIVV